MIDLETARGLLARAVLTQGPDFVYNSVGPGRISCYNVPMPGSEVESQRKTGCLVGTALKLAGVYLAPASTTPIDSSSFDHCRDNAAKAYLREAQEEQDAGGTWGAAYAAAEAKVKTIRLTVKV